MKAQIEHILTFVEVVETGSFTKAAELLNLSRSVVSKHITALEFRLKSQLFLRSTRKLQLTEAGRLLYSQTKMLPEQIKNAEDSLDKITNTPSGRLKVYAPANLSSSIKEKALPNFLKSYPQISLDINFVRPITEYLEQPYDLIILWKLDSQNFPNYNLVGTKLFSMPVGVYATPEYIKKHGEPQTPEALIDHNCFSSIGMSWPFKQEDKAIEEINVQGNLMTNDEEIIYGATLNRLGIAYSYPFVFEQALENNQVVQILPDYTNIKVEIYAFHHPGPYVSKRIKCFVEHFKEYYQKIQSEIHLRGVADYRR